MHKRHFTLVELMAAMLVLVIMMGFLFKFIASSQDLWSASERNSRVYENAQIFFELVDRDLGGAMVNDIPGQEIGFWVGSTADTTDGFLTMVSNVTPPTEDEYSICEVHYRLSPTSNPTFSLLERDVVGQEKDITTPNPAWDFYGRAAASGTPAWVGTPSGVTPNWQEVIDGVETITMECYNAAGAIMAPAPPRSYLSLPTAVKFTITLVDQKVIDLGLTGPALDARLDASRRQFTKIIFLNR